MGFYLFFFFLQSYKRVRPSFLLICSYSALSFPLLKTQPNCWSYALWGVTVRSGCQGRLRGLERKALHSAGYGRFGEDLNSPQPYTDPCNRNCSHSAELAGKVQKWKGGEQKKKNGRMSDLPYLTSKVLNCAFNYV